MQWYARDDPTVQFLCTLQVSHETIRERNYSISHITTLRNPLPIRRFATKYNISLPYYVYPFRACTQLGHLVSPNPY